MPAAIAHTASLKRLSDLIPRGQKVETAELLKTPFPAHHQGVDVTVKAVLVHTAVVYREGDEPYLARVTELEVAEHQVQRRKGARRRNANNRPELSRLFDQMVRGATAGFPAFEGEGAR